MEKTLTRNGNSRSLKELSKSRSREAIDFKQLAMPKQNRKRDNIHEEFSQATNECKCTLVTNFLGPGSYAGIEGANNFGRNKVLSIHRNGPAVGFPKSNRNSMSMLHSDSSKALLQATTEATSVRNAPRLKIIKNSTFSKARRFMSISKASKKGGDSEPMVTMLEEK